MEYFISMYDKRYKRGNRETKRHFAVALNFNGSSWEFGE